MRKLSLYIAVSIDGFIAEKNGAVDFLHDKEYAVLDEDFGFKDFYGSVDTTLMGRKTFQEILGFDVPFPYVEKKNYVFTRNQNSEPHEYVEFVREDPVSFVRKLKEQEGKGIWLVGGGIINALLLEHGLIDRMILTTVPVTLGDGIPLFAPGKTVHKFKFKSAKSFSNGFAQLEYSKKKAGA
ncbi:MAG: dihydrofolate reductase family protein [Cytophagales bacterium]|nr:dihydrofolate reductase family protein [Cytophagales bacterium]